VVPLLVFQPITCMNSALPSFMLPECIDYGRALRLQSEQ
jgi:hypothetical protein